MILTEIKGKITGHRFLDEGATNVIDQERIARANPCFQSMSIPVDSHLQCPEENEVHSLEAYSSSCKGGDDKAGKPCSNHLSGCQIARIQTASTIGANSNVPKNFHVSTHNQTTLQQSLPNDIQSGDIREDSHPSPQA